MRKFHVLPLVAIVVSSAIYSCNKEEAPSKIQRTEQIAVWRTPNGYVIPYSERDNWKRYVQENFTTEKMEAKRYKSQSCSTDQIVCGLECVLTKEKEADCNKASACAPCVNCCNPVIGQ